MSPEKPAAREEALREAVAEALTDQRGRVLASIRRSLGDAAEADDVLQDVFAEFVEAYQLGTAVESVGAWLFRVARNKVFDRLRRRRTREEHRFLVEADPQAGVVEPGNEWMRDWLRAEIVRALEALPAEQRRVFVEHELEGKSFEEIADASGVGVNTLLSRKRYAIAALRKHLKEVYDEL